MRILAALIGSMRRHTILWPRAHWCVNYTTRYERAVGLVLAQADVKANICCTLYLLVRLLGTSTCSRSNWEINRSSWELGVGIGSWELGVGIGVGVGRCDGTWNSMTQLSCTRGPQFQYVPRVLVLIRVIVISLGDRSSYMLHVHVRDTCTCKWYSDTDTDICTCNSCTRTLVLVLVLHACTMDTGHRCT